MKTFLMIILKENFLKLEVKNTLGFLLRLTMEAPFL